MRKDRSLSGNLHQFIESLTVALEARDPYTGKHSYRVAEMGGSLADVLGWSAAASEQIHLAGHIHDIGKIGIPDSILRKPCALSDHEFELLKQHTTIGWEILSQVDALAEIAPWVRWHHERFDGRGYPDRLAGYDIPEGARIIAVPDAFDAMLSNRPYRHGMKLSRALKELENHRGTQFDPNILDAFLGIAIDLYDRLYNGNTEPQQLPKLRC